MLRQTFPLFPARRTGLTRLVRGALIAMLAIVFGITNAPGPAAAQSGFPNPGDRLMVNTDALNLRNGQGLDFEVIDVLPYGTGLTFVSLPASGSDDGHDWYQVRTDDGTEGWVAGEYLAPVSGGDGIPAGTAVFVVTDFLNVRAAPSLDADVIDLVVSGDDGVTTDGPVVADRISWWAVDFSNGASGWVAGDYISFGATPGGIQIDDLVMVDTDALNIREGAGLDANVIDQLTYGFTASVIAGPISADGYTWYEISTSAITGWVAGEYLTVQ